MFVHDLLQWLTHRHGKLAGISDHPWVRASGKFSITVESAGKCIYGAPGAGVDGSSIINSVADVVIIGLMFIT